MGDIKWVKPSVTQFIMHKQIESHGSMLELSYNFHRQHYKTGCIISHFNNGDNNNDLHLHYYMIWYEESNGTFALLYDMKNPMGHVIRLAMIHKRSTQCPKSLRNYFPCGSADSETKSKWNTKDCSPLYEIIFVNPYREKFTFEISVLTGQLQVVLAIMLTHSYRSLEVAYNEK